MISSAGDDCPLVMDLQFTSCATAGAPVFPNLQDFSPRPLLDRFSPCASDRHDLVDLARSQQLTPVLIVRQVVEINFAVKDAECCLSLNVAPPPNSAFDPSTLLEAIAPPQQRSCLVVVDYPRLDRLILLSKELFAKRVEPSEPRLIELLRNRDSPTAADTFHTF